MSQNERAELADRKVRVQRPERFQVRWRDASLDQLIPADHRVRAVWAYVESLDLRPLYAKIRAVEGGVGRDAVDPKILLALWLLATIEGISSARHLQRLTTRDLPYLWICGDVGVNYHLLADFRTAHGEFFNQLLTDTIATLLHQGLAMFAGGAGTSCECYCDDCREACGLRSEGGVCVRVRSVVC